MSSRTIDKVAGVLEAHPGGCYWGLVGVVAILLLSHTLNQRWAYDFWEDAAVVNELAHRPWSPMHPEVDVKAPQEFTNPYTLGAGLLAIATGWQSVKILSLLGFVNLFLLAWGLWRFSVRILGSKPAAPLALMLMLCLWGPLAYNFSGFWHLKAIGDTLPLPSAFAGALTLLTLSLYWDVLAGKSRTWMLLVAALLSVVTISHPPTAVPLCVGLGVLWAAKVPPRRLIASGLLLVLALASGAGLALLWPYYPLLGLTVPSAAEHQEANIWLYRNVLLAVGPALMGVPLVLGRLRVNRRDPLALFFLALVLVYAYGWISRKYLLGRSLVFWMLCLDMGIADWLAPKPAALVPSPGPSRSGRIARYATIGIVGLCVAGFGAIGLYRYAPGRKTTNSLLTLDHYSFLRGHILQDDVVLADVQAARIVPILGGKVVATVRAEAFVPDLPQRQEAVRLFFSPETDDAFRADLIVRHRVKFILLNKADEGQSQLLGRLLRFGTVVADNRWFYLLLVKGE